METDRNETLICQSGAEEIVAMMMKQELTTYQRRDFLATNSLLLDIVDSEWRQRIVEWMYSVIDHCSLRRDSVAVATFYLDLVTERGLTSSRQDYQVAAMACLQLAIKLYDSTMVKLDSMVKLGRGLFTEKDVIDMEARILFALNWQVHPPTAVCYLRQFLCLLPETIRPTARYIIAEVTRFIAEVSVCLYKFALYPTHVVTYSGLLVAMQRVDGVNLSNYDRQEILSRLSRVVGLDHTSALVREVSSELLQALEKNISLQDLIDTIETQCKFDTHVSIPSKGVPRSPARVNSPRDIIHRPW